MWYLTNEEAIQPLLEATNTTLNDLESIVGRFKNTHHRWPGKLKGKWEVKNGEVRIRHHFSKKILHKQGISYEQI